MRLLLALGAAAVLASPVVVAQTQPPIFRGGVEVIEVDVSVVDDRGRPMTDLAAPEFTVTVDDTPRRVVEAQWFSLRPAERDERQREPGPPEVFYTSNATDLRGRLIVIAVDRGSISFGGGGGVIQAAGRFLDTLGPRDRVAFLAVPQPGPLVDFTANHARVRQAVEGMVGLDSPHRQRYNMGISEAVALARRGNPVVEARVFSRFCGQYRPGSDAFDECALDVRLDAVTIAQDARSQAADSLRVLESVLEAMRDMDGPKSLVWISQGLLITDPIQGLTGIARLAAASRTTVNVVMVDAPLTAAAVAQMPASPREDRRLREEGLETLAGMTRGALYRAYQNPDRVFQRLEEELSGYYVLGIEALPTDRDGERHAIAVSVGRRGATLRARHEFRFTPQAQVADESVQERLMRMLRSPFATAELPLRLASYAYRDAAGSRQVQLVIATEIDGDRNEPTDLSMAYSLLDREGTVVLSGTERTTATPVETPNGPVLNIAWSLLVEPGSYALRLAVVDGGGRRGSVEHPVQAWQMTEVPFAVGDLMLVDAPSGPGEAIHAPVEARLSSGLLVAYMELYAESPDVFEGTRVRFDVAADESGPAQASGDGVLTMGADTTARLVSTGVPVDHLPPGHYLARASVLRDAEEVARLYRPFEISSTPLTSISTILAAPPAFDPDQLLTSEVVDFFMDALDRGRPALEATTAQVRAGTLQGAGRQAFETGDQMAASFLRGLELFAEGQLNAAGTQFAAALRIDPQFAPAVFYLGACFAAAGQDGRAATEWHRLLLIRGTSRIAYAYAALADLLLRVGEPVQAIEPLREALAVWPDDDGFRRRLGVVYSRTHLYGDALDLLEPYIARHPDDTEALLVAAHAIYALRLIDDPGLSEADAQDRLARYAQAYADARGPHAALVAGWAATLTR